MCLHVLLHLSLSVDLGRLNVFPRKSDMSTFPNEQYSQAKAISQCVCVCAHMDGFLRRLTVGMWRTHSIAREKTLLVLQREVEGK